MPSTPSSSDRRIVVLDWGLTQTFLALGLTPLGVPAPDWYSRYAVTPTLPAGVTDVGLLFTPNFELIQALAPKAIIITPALTPARPLLQRIARTEPFSIFLPGLNLLDRTRRETERLADFLDHRAAFSALAGETDRAFAEAREKLTRYDGRPLYLVSLLNDRYVTVHTPNGLYDSVATALGLRNAWTRATLGGSAPAPLETLAAVPEARLIVIRTPTSDGPDRRLSASLFWQALPFVRQGRVHVIDPVMSFGGLPAAARFAVLLTAALNEPEVLP